MPAPFDAFVLRQDLEALAAAIEAALAQGTIPGIGPSPTPVAVPPLKPHWVKTLPEHQLLLGSRVMKRVRPLARNVIRVFDAFEEEGWPQHIDDPTDPGKLHETLRSINGGLEGLRFRADGTGKGILWEVP